MKKHKRPELHTKMPGKRSGKKAQADTQFNWIFVLIVGALILSFFAYIVIKQKSSAEIKFSGKLAQQLDAIISGARVATGTIQEIPTPEVSIRFTCNDYYIGSASRRLGNRVVFAPEFVEGTKLTTWTLDWNVPYKVTSFLYITSDLVKYYIVHEPADETIARRIYESLPETLEKEMVTVSDYESISDEGYKYARFIFVIHPGIPFRSYNEPDMDATEISGISVDTSSGTFRFLERSGGGLQLTGNTYKYTEEELMFGAIFSTMPEDFECLAERAYERLNLVSRVYLGKLNTLSNEFAGRSCEGYYKNNQNLQAIITASLGGIPENNGLTSIATAKNQLEEQQIKLQLGSCPLIY